MRTCHEVLSRERPLAFSFKTPFIETILLEFVGPIYCLTRLSWRCLSERDRLLPSFSQFPRFYSHPIPYDSQTSFQIGRRIYPWLALSCFECFTKSQEFDKAASDHGSFYQSSHSLGAHQGARSVTVSCIPCLLYSWRIR